jgi:hypothetical protein
MIAQGRRKDLAVGSPFNPTAGKIGYPFGFYEAPTGGTPYQLSFFRIPPALSAVGPACSVRPAHPRLGPLDVFFYKSFFFFVITANFKFKYLLNRKSELGEICAKIS